MISLKRHAIFLALFVPIALYFAFGYHHLAQFETTDKHYWVYNLVDGRIHDYWQALANGKREDTLINDKPGITLAYISGIGLLFQGDPNERIIENTSAYKRYQPEVTERFNILFRLPLLIFNGLA